MRYEDASGTFQASGPIANDDSDTLTAGSRGPATGNLLTGEGTQYGSAGADSAAGAQVTAIAGKGGEDSSFAGGKLSVSGEFGQLSVDADGNYSYLANTGAPENVRDRFVYTLADTQGNSDTAALIVEIGKTPVVIKADAQQVVPGPDGVVTLPPGVELSDIMVVGRNLVVNMPDGTQLVIVDGAVFVPQLVLGGVEVPATNVAALLIGQEVQPAAGETPPSSGGNFALPPPPLDPGIPLGDLLPPTELDYNPPEPQDVFPVPDDEEPEITIQPDGQPASVNAVDEVDEAGLPGRDGNLPDEPEGSGEEAAAGDNGDPSEATGGTIIIDSPDGVDSVTIAGADGIPHEIVVGLIVEGEFGTLTITDQVGDNYVYSYVLNDNTPGDDTQDDFEVVLTDGDGDTATATLTIDIIDDVPTARPDTDVIAAGEFGPVTGNVITDADGGDEGDDDDGRDTVGADDADLTDVTGFGDTEAVEGGWVVQGQYGVLTISSDGSYSYTRNEGTPGGVTDVFNYDLTDGDGDVSSTTLTITIEDTPIEIGENPIVRTDDDAVAGADGNAGTPEIGDDVDSENLTGTLSGSGGDGPLTFDLLTTGAPDGFTYVDGPDGSVLVQQVQNGSTVTVLTITINASTGAYEVTQDAPILHPEGGDIENNLDFTINYTVSDQDDDVENGTLTINVDDDSPSIEAGEVEPELLVDESELTVNETQNFGDVFTALFGADGGDADSTEYLLDINAGATGLTDTATGEDVVLVMNDGVVEGRTATTNELVFTVTVNDDGDVTVDQLRAVVHPDDSDPDDPIGLANDDLITLTATVTDNDGDTASETIGIGNNIVLEDDGPTANDDVGNQAGEDQPITVDVLANDEAGADGVDDADVSYVDGTLTGSGELVYNGDGTFTYTPAPGETGDIFFDYQILDGDNDPSVATVTIHLGDDSTPQVGTPENLEVDEDGFAFANDDEGQVNPTETDHGENLTDSGNVVVDFGNDVPGDLDASIVLLDNGALDGQLVDLDGNPVTFTLNGSGQLVGSTANGTVMIISITAAAAGPGAGEVTYTYEAELLQPVQHADAGNNENTDILSGVQFQVTDSDGDPATGSFNVTVVDDVPSATVDAQVTVPTLTLDESPTGEDEGGDDTPAGDNSVTVGFAGNFETAEYGADGAGTTEYSLELSEPGAASGLFALEQADVTAGDGDGIGQGAEILLFANLDGSVSGRLTADGPAYFTISVNASGQVTFTQHLNVWHSNTGSDDDTSSLSADAETLQLVQSVTDADGDTATAALDLSDGVFEIEDDGPAFTSDPADAIAENGDSDPVIAALNLDIGTDGYGLLFFNPDHDGDPAMDAEGNPLSLGGEPLFYQVNGNILTAETADGDLGFTITLNTDGTYTFDVNDEISNGTGAGIETFSGIKAGNTDAFLVGAGNDDTPFDIIFTAEDGAGTQVTVNNSQGRIATGNQGIDAGETVRIDLVEDLEVAAVSGSNPFGVAYSGHVTGVTHYEQTILQVIGGGNPVVDILFQVANSDNDTILPIPSEGGTDEPLVNITEATIRDAETGNEYRFTEGGQIFVNDVLLVGPNTTGFTVNFSGTGALVTGIESGDVVELDTATEFNTVFVTSANTNAGNEKFDLGGIFIGQQRTQDPILQDFDIVAQDRDGDQETATISTTINPPAETLAATSFMAQDEQLQKTAANSNTLTIAAAVAAAGMTESVAASPPEDDQSLQVESEASVSNMMVDMQPADDGGEDASSIAGLPESSDASEVSGNSGSHGRSFDHRSDNSIDASSKQQSSNDEGSYQAANDQGPAPGAAPAHAVAPDVAMVSAEMLAAAGLTGETAKHHGTVEEILADALGQGGAPTVDGLLAQLPGGLSELAAISDVASPAAGGVPVWDMAMHGGGGFAAEMLTKLDAAMLQHHDAVQPVING